MTTSIDSSLNTGLEPREDDNRLLKIKKLKSKLINEEHRLVLMKKIRQSQTRPIPATPIDNNNVNVNNNNNNNLNSSTNNSVNNISNNNSPSTNHNNSVVSNQSGSNQNFKKLRPSSQLSAGPLSLQKNNNLTGSSPMNQTPAHAHQRPKVSNLWNPPPQQVRHPTPIGIAPPHVGNLSRQPITTPPNVVQDLRGGFAGQQQACTVPSAVAAVTSSATISRRPQPTPPQQTSSFNKSQAAQMLLQKRTAAKAAIQKQLEQTLMQLPQKHVQLCLDFIPNANNVEFVHYIGLEACVDYLTGTKSLSEIQPLEKPFECSTCGTDFTPSWSWKRSNAVCENCVSNHVKKSIKNSQAGRIKSVLAKAAKQEQDVEQRIMNEAATVVSSPSITSQQSQLHHTSHHNSPQQHSLLQPTSHHQRTSLPQPLWPRLNAPPLTSTSSNRHQNIQPPAINTNPLAAVAGMQPAALASLLQSNPQLSSLASLMTATTSNNTSTKNSQAGRIKSVLAKAVKQEQDVEQRILNDAANIAPSPSSTSRQPQLHNQIHHQPPQQQQHSLLQPTSQHQRTSQSQQLWPRLNAPPLTSTSSNRQQNIQPPPAINTNPLAAIAGMQPAALASLLQMNPQLSTLASLMNANNSNNNNNNQLAQVTALLMNQLTMSLWKR